MNEKYEIRLLNHTEAEAFKNMTYGRYKPFIAWMDNVLGRLFPVGLYCEGLPAGLLLAIHLSSEKKRICFRYLSKKNTAVKKSR